MISTKVQTARQTGVDLLGIDPTATTPDRLVLAPCSSYREMGEVRAALATFLHGAKWPEAALVLDVSRFTQGGLQIIEEILANELLGAVKCGRFAAVSVFGMPEAQMGRLERQGLRLSGVELSTSPCRVSSMDQDLHDNARVLWGQRIQDVLVPKVKQAGLVVTTEAVESEAVAPSLTECSVPCVRSITGTELEARLASAPTDKDGRRVVDLTHDFVARSILEGFVFQHLRDVAPLRIVISAENHASTRINVKRPWGNCHFEVAADS